MARVSDLIRDLKLETSFHPDCSVETVHTYQESDLTSRRRVVARSEHWKRLSKIGGGAYGSVWLEKCIRDSHQRSVQALRAVKQIDLDTRYGPIDYNRELEAIAKFSHSRVCMRRICTSSETAILSFFSMCDALFGHLGGMKPQISYSLQWNILNSAICINTCTTNHPCPKSKQRKLLSRSWRAWA